jgi:hypothetical protein
MNLTKTKFEEVLVAWRQLLPLDDKLDFVYSQVENKRLGKKKYTFFFFFFLTSKVLMKAF